MQWGQFDPQVAAMTWAANVSIDPSDLAGRVVDGALTDSYEPEATLKTLPPDGVLILAWFSDRPVSPNNPNFPSGTLPLRLSDAQVARSREGQVAPNVPQYLIEATVDGRSLDVRVYFGTLSPSASTLQTAQRELDGMQLPPSSS